MQCGITSIERQTLPTLARSRSQKAQSRATQKAQKAVLQFCDFCAFSWLLFFVTVPAVGFFDAEFFETVLEGAEGEAEQFGRLRDVVVRLLHRLRD